MLIVEDLCQSSFLAQLNQRLFQDVRLKALKVLLPVASLRVANFVFGNFCVLSILFVVHSLILQICRLNHGRLTEIIYSKPMKRDSRINRAPQCSTTVLFRSSLNRKFFKTQIDSHSPADDGVPRRNKKEK